MSYVERNNSELEIISTPINTNPIVGAHPSLESVRQKVQASGWLHLSVRLMVDLSLGYAAFLIAYMFRFSLLSFDDTDLIYAPVSFEQYLLIGIFYSLALVTVLSFKGFYSLPHNIALSKELLLLGNAVLTTTVIVTMTMLLTQPSLFFSRLVFIYLMPLTVIILGAERLLIHQFRYSRLRRGVGVRNLIVVGATNAGVRVMRTISEKIGLGYNLIGYVDDHIRYSDWTIPARYGNSIKRTNREVPHLGVIGQLNQLIEQHRVHEVIVALPSKDYHLVSEVIGHCHRYGLTITIIPDLFELKPGEMSVQAINGVPLITTDKPRLSGMNAVLKRGIDMLGTLAALTLGAIPMLLIALAIRLDSKGPVIFRQTRIGKHGKPFTFYKFRSMYTDADARWAELVSYNETQGATFKMKNDPRVTRVGRFLRRTSLDELPQLFNVLLGQMSLVGPRPGLERELANYQPWQHRRLEIMPGLTGLWQVNGRSDVSFDEMVKLDIYYAEHWTLFLDIKILFKTVQAVIKRDGAY